MLCTNKYIQMQLAKIQPFMLQNQNLKNGVLFVKGTLGLILLSITTCTLVAKRINVCNKLALQI